MLVIIYYKLDFDLFLLQLFIIFFIIEFFFFIKIIYVKIESKLFFFILVSNPLNLFRLTYNKN